MQKLQGARSEFRHKSQPSIYGVSKNVHKQEYNGLFRQSLQYDWIQKCATQCLVSLKE